MRIGLPNGWRPRPYQQGLWNHLEKGGRRAVAIWHRRAGKDDVLLHWTAVAAHRRVGTYWHLLPEAAQARKAIWESVNPHTGKRRIDEAFPPELREVTRENEMFIRFRSGSTWQLVGSDNYDCYSADTEILTKDGWLLFSELTGDELVATLEEGDELVYSPIRAIVSYDYDGEMYRVYNNAIDLLTTPNHRFYVESGKGVRKFKRIDEPTILGYKIPATCHWRGIEPRKFTLPVIDYNLNTRSDYLREQEFSIEDWCAFMGIFLSEGSTFSDARGNYRVVISQKKPDICADIEALLTRMELHHRYDASPGNFVIANKQLFEYCRQFGRGHEKFVPANLKELSPRLLNILIDWLVKGDGNINYNNTLSYSSTSKRLADDFQELLIKTGLSGNIRTRTNYGTGMIRGRPIHGSRPLYSVYRRISKYKYFRDTEESYVSQEPYAGKVWCVDAGSHVIKVRRNGKEAWCGNSLVGSPPIGVVFSEAALSDPNAWGYIRPILLENQGWAVFISTPRGRNHLATMYEAAKDDPDWFAEILPATETGVFSAKALETERKEMAREYGPDDGENRYLQEYMCSFQAGIPGSYYGRMMDDAEVEGRLCRVPHEPRLPVHVSYDLGIGDATALWFFQMVGAETRAIRYLENSGVGIDWYVRELDKFPYKYGEHVLPHDAEVRELGTGKSRLEVMNSLGILRTTIVPAQRIEDGINAVRQTLPGVWFDKDNCSRGIDALRSYRRNWDEKRKTFLDRPYHDWASHGADSFRYWSLAGVRNASKPQPIKYPDYGFV